MTTPGSDDIQLDPPLARHSEFAPAVEDRSYIIFVGGALVMALGGGFLLSVLLPLTLSGTLDWPGRSIFLLQAHGWAQLQGWAGLFVAGMAIRLIPRFAGRKPIPARINIGIFLLLFGGAAGRTLAQSLLSGSALETAVLVSSVPAALGTLGVAAILAVTLSLGRKKREPWRFLAWAGAIWWAAWAVLLVRAGFRAFDNQGIVPPQFDDAMAWAVMLGAIGNFIFGVQSRSVPVFFGRKTPSIARVAVPAVLLNAGAATVLLSRMAEGAIEQRLLGAGLASAGIALLWLPPVAGSVRGRATRLRPRARAAARYVLAANISGVVAGLLLLWAGTASLVSGEFEAFGVRDAARHAFGLGLITMLIVGMAQLIAPVFALERAEPRPPGMVDHIAWWGLLSAVVLRVIAGLLVEADQVDLTSRMHLAALSGVLAWIGLAMFALSVIRAVRKEPAMRELLRAAVPPGR
ncbi:MAG TPA: hypothetical protein VIH05_00505 [Tepidiformaceae bacterium]